MADVSVTINPPNSTSVTIGSAVSIHGSAHYPGGTDSLENYYYPRTNPSGYATSGDFATTGYVGEVSGYLYSQIAFPSNVVFTTGGQTIGGAKNFSTRPTVNGTGVLLSGEASVGDTGYLTGYVQKIETGNFVTSSQTGNFYPRSNPSGYITGVNLSAYQTIVASTGISGYLQEQVGSLNTSTGMLNVRLTSVENQTGNFALKSATGSFITTGVGDLRYYPLSSNPSLYLVSADLSSYSTIGYVTGVSGHLQSQISSISLTALQNATGNLDLRVQTLEGQSGQWMIGYNDSITGINIAGTSSKTITLYQRDGSTLTASFSDIEGTGGGGTDYFLTGASFNSADGNLSLYVNDGSVITESLDGRYVTGNVVRPSETGSFVVVGDLNVYQTVSASTGISGYLQNQIDSIDLAPTGAFLTTGAADSRYYPLAANPSNYLVSADIANLATTGYVFGASGYLQSQITSISNGTGNFITGVNLSSYQTISASTGISGYLQGQISAIDLTPLQAATGNLNTRVLAIETVSGDFALKANTGAFLTTGAGDSRFYPLSSNPSNYLVLADVANLAATGYVTGVSGYLQLQISSINSSTGQFVTGSVVRPSETGNFITASQTGRFVPYTGATADINLGENSLLAHGVSGDASHGLNIGSNNGTTCAVFGVGGGANSTFYGGLKADYSTAARVAIFDSSKNLISSSVSSGELNYLTGVSSPIQIQINNIIGNTGAFLTTGSADSRYYPLSSNPSSYLTAADIANLATTGYVTGVSGYLQNQVSTLNLFTGQSSSGYNRSITGLSVGGTDTKTITLYQQNGSTITANFSDLQGTGGSVSNVVYLTGDQNISGVKNFVSRPTVNGTGILLSGESSSGGGSSNIWIPASAWIPRTTSGCGVDSRELTTNRQNFDELLFDAASNEFAQALTIMPNNYNNGSVTSRFYWTASTGSGDVVWGIQGRAFANDDALDSAFGTAQTVTDSLLAINDMHVTSATAAVTFAGTPAANTPIQLQIYRDAVASGDLLSDKARLLGVEIIYTST